MVKTRLLRSTIVLAVTLITIGMLGSVVSQAFWNVNPPAQPGFPALLAGGQIYEASPTLADLNGNGDLEIVVAGRSRNGDSLGCGGWVYAYRADGALYWQTEVRAPVNASPTVADLNGDNKPEVLVGLGGWVDSQCWNGGLVALNGQTGQQLWMFDTQDWLNHVHDGWRDGVFSTPAVGDVDGDGDPEIAFGAWDQCVYLLDHNGDPLWGNLPGILPGTYCGGHGYYLEDTIWSSPALADLTGDGMLEIVIGADISTGNVGGDPSGGYLRVYDYQGNLLATVWMNQVIYSSPAVGDIDHDGELEIVVGTGTYWPGTGYYVTAFRYDSTCSVNERLVQEWRSTTRGRVFSSPALADLNEDGYLDVVVTSLVGDWSNNNPPGAFSEVYAWRGQDGGLLFSTPICDSFGNSHPVRSSPTVADVDGDGHLEVLFSHAWEVSILNHDGTYYTDYSNPSAGPPAESVCARTTPPDTNLTYWTNYSVFASPAVGDLDNDGDMEVAIGGAQDVSHWSRGRLYVWTGHPSGEQPWPMFHRDAQHMGRFPRPPALSVISAPLHILHQSGDPSDAETDLLVLNTGDEPFTWSAEAPSGVALSETSGTVLDKVQVLVAVDTGGYGDGTYEVGTINVTGEADGSPVENSPIDVPVILHVCDIRQVFLPLVVKR